MSEQTCPTCGCPAEGPGDHHVIAAGFLNPNLLAGDNRRTVRCMDCQRVCGALPNDPIIED